MAKLKKPLIRNRYDYESRPQAAIHFDYDSPESRSITNQSDAKEADVNFIMSRYEKTGLIPDNITGDMRQPQFGDFSDVGDFHTIQSRVARVKQAFEAYPAHIRNRFQNDPAQLIEFLSDAENDAEAIKLGLKNAPEPENGGPEDGPKDSSEGNEETTAKQPKKGSKPPLKKEEGEE